MLMGEIIFVITVLDKPRIQTVPPRRMILLIKMRKWKALPEIWLSGRFLSSTEKNRKNDGLGSRKFYAGKDEDLMYAKLDKH